MLLHYTKLLFFFLSAFLLLNASSALCQPVSLKITGDAQQGFRVDIYNNGQLIVTDSEEFSLKLYNLDLSTEANMDHWTGESWTRNENSITLKRNSYLKEFDADISVTVNYQIVNPNVIKQKVELFQPSMPDMYYILKETSRPAQKPLRYVTFEYDSFPGGLVHEMFPSAGFITTDNNVVGFLTDAGYKNQYTRNTRRRFSGRGGGFVGLRRLSDPELFSIAGLSERAENNNYIRQTYGEMYNLDAGSKTILKLPTLFENENAEVKNDANIISIKGHSGNRAGIDFIVPLKDKNVYTISFWCKGNSPVALKLFRVRNGEKTVELEDGLKYIDNFPINKNEWTLFKGSILVPYIENDSISLFVGTQSRKESDLQIKDLRIVQHEPQREPYNILPLGKKVEKTTYIFVEPWKSHQQFIISSQSRLAEGKGFKGSLIEKMLYANFNMLTWITDTKDFTPFNVPNLNYSPDMYNRDCFFSTVSTYNKELNL
ncbi:MAG TPA: hypothetical protein VLI68_11615, partial [Hanamia sp.]|nr:hypothetical protein [Hanamia sp.]